MKKQIFFLLLLRTLFSSCQPSCPNCTGNVCLQCPSHFYPDNDECLQCHWTCAECDGGDTRWNCTECYSNRFYNSYRKICILKQYCKDYMPGCLDCDVHNSCLECSDDYFMYTWNSGVNNKCKKCEVGFQYFSNTTYPYCQQICGDSLVFDLPCDLGAGTEYDGCVDQCQFQTDFSCYSEGNQSICSYYGVFNLSLLSQQKELFQNKMTLKFSLTPIIYIFKTFDPSPYFSYNDSSFHNLEFSFDYESGEVTSSFTYIENSQNRPFKIFLKLSTSSDGHFYATEDHEWQGTIQVSEILPAIYYSDEYYTYAKFLYYFGFLLVGLSLLICIIGIFSPHKLAGLEIMFVVQYIFVVVFWMKDFLPLSFYILKVFKYSCGYNFPYEEITATETPPQSQVMQMNRQYLSSNLNYFAISYILSIIGILVCKIIHYKMEDKKKKSQFLLVVQTAHEVAFYCCMFKLTYLTTCLTLFYTYGNLSDPGSQIIAAFCTAITIGIFIYFTVSPGIFYRFRLCFKATTLTFFHYFLHVICIVSSILLLNFLPDQVWAPLIPQGTLFLYTLLRRPYQFLSENLRSSYNLLVMCGISSIRLYFYYTDEQAKRGESVNIYPVVLEVGIFFMILWAYIVVIKDIFEKHCLALKRDLVFDLVEQAKTLEKVERLALRSHLFKPEDIFNSFRIKGIASLEQIERQKKQREEEFVSSVKLTPQQEQFLEQMKKQELPNQKQVIKIVQSQLDFLRYQNAIKQSERFKGEIDKEKLKIFDQL